ncbi:MAG: amino acid ABC transporter substrate-binding protein [Spirochaetes bacterium]|nr:MAG: amino acid ABC transporter substrate-binding protein [Spirochaetota bacterium]
MKVLTGKRIVLIVLVIGMLFSASQLWSGGKKEAATVAPVKFGGLVPLTGALSEFGEGFRKAGDLAVKQFTEAGFPIEIKYGDTETSAIPGVEAARSLVDVERVKALIGAAASGVTLPIAESVAIPKQVPQISNASTSPLITVLPADEGKDFLFRTCPSDALQGIILGKLAADEGYKKAAVLWVNNAYGQGLMERFKEAFEARGGQVVASVPHDEKPAPTYVSELRQIMQAEPDVMLALAYPGQATVYLKEFFEAGYNKTTDLLFCDGTKSVEMPMALGAENLAGFYGTAPGTVAGNTLKQFEADYKAEYGELPPLPFMSNFYDAVVVAGLAAAAAQARGLDITPVNVRDMLRVVANPPGEEIGAGVEEFKKAIQLLKDGKDINYEGAAGSVDFDDNGDVVTPIEIWQYVESDPFIKTVRMETEIPAK